MLGPKCLVLRSKGGSAPPFLYFYKIKIKIQKEECSSCLVLSAKAGSAPPPLGFIFILIKIKIKKGREFSCQGRESFLLEGVLSYKI